jgi:hypothetical protein
MSANAVTGQISMLKTTSHDRLQPAEVVDGVTRVAAKMAAAKLF